MPTIVSPYSNGVLANSTMREGFEYGTIKLPNPSQVVGCDYDPLPYFILGNKIFPLKSWLLRPFAGRNLSEEKHRIRKELKKGGHVKSMGKPLEAEEQQ